MYARRLGLAGLLVVAASARAQPVQGDVHAVGFQAPDGFRVRPGQWIPIQVRLTAQGSQVFAGELRVECIDLDGDRVEYVAKPVTVTPQAGIERAWIYAVANDVLNEFPATINILSADGVLIHKLPVPPAVPVSNDDVLVLDISRSSSLRRGTLTAPGAFYRNVVVTQLPNGAPDLPDRWWGLEAVDVIVWDEPDPASLSLAQLDALIEWVRSGGQLIVGVGASWGAIRKSTLAAIMPLEGEGPVVELTDLKGFADRVAAPGWTSGKLEQPVALATARKTVDALSVVKEWNPAAAADKPIELITLRLVGSGRVIATAASLRDLNNAPIAHEKFLRLLLDLNAYSTEFRKALDASSYQMGLPGGGIAPLHKDIVGEVSFSGAGALRGLAAFLFVAAYVVVATVVSWWWLRARHATHLSWTLFAAFAVVASVLSLGTVSALSGLQSGVQSFEILDLEAGSSTARGRCLFGYRSPVRQTVAFSLPGEGNFLRPLARRAQDKIYYVTPSRYAALPGRARLDDVLMRATLKQVDGFWHGELNGTIRADLAVSRGPDPKDAGRLTTGSWIINELPLDIEEGYLLFIDPRQIDMPLDKPWSDARVPPRVDGITWLYDRSAELPDVPPAMNVLAVRLPRIRVGQQINGLGADQYRTLDQRTDKWRPPKDEREKRKQQPDLDTLHELQQDWVSAKWERTVPKALLASTRNLYLQCSGKDFDRVGTPITTDGLPELDITHWLLGGEQGVAVLLCWTKDPGPARLSRDGKEMKSIKGLTLYRVRVPIRYVGSPPAPKRGSEP